MIISKKTKIKKHRHPKTKIKRIHLAQFTLTKLLRNLSEHIIFYHIRTFGPKTNTVIISLRKSYEKTERRMLMYLNMESGHFS